MISKYAVTAILKHERRKWQREIHGTGEFTDGFRAGLKYAISIIDEINQITAEKIRNNPQRYTKSRMDKSYFLKSKVKS